MDGFKMRNDIRIHEPQVERDNDDRITSVSVLFGPEYWVKVEQRNGSLFFTLRGGLDNVVELEASHTGGDLDTAIRFMRDAMNGSD